MQDRFLGLEGQRGEMAYIILYKVTLLIYTYENVVGMECHIIFRNSARMCGNENLGERGRETPSTDDNRNIICRRPTIDMIHRIFQVAHGALRYYAI